MDLVFGHDWTKDRKKVIDKNPIELQEATALNWLWLDSIRVTSIGNENTYYINEFGIKFYCKNYPDNELVGWGTIYAPASTYQ